MTKKQAIQEKGQCSIAGATYFFFLWLSRGRERMKFYLKSMRDWCWDEHIALRALLALAED